MKRISLYRADNSLTADKQGYHSKIAITEEHHNQANQETHDCGHPEFFRLCNIQHIRDAADQRAQHSHQRNKNGDEAKHRHQHNNDDIDDGVDADSN